MHLVAASQCLWGEKTVRFSSETQGKKKGDLNCQTETGDLT